MTIDKLPDTLSEPRFSFGRQIEYIVTNGLGYNTQTDFHSDFHTPEEIKNSKKGLQAHLAHLEMKSSIPQIRAVYFLLENAPPDYEFFVYQKRAFGLLGKKITKKPLNQKQRAKEMQILAADCRHYEEMFNFYKEDAEYPSVNEKVAKYLMARSGLNLTNLIDTVMTLRQTNPPGIR